MSSQNCSFGQRWSDTTTELEIGDFGFCHETDKLADICKHLLIDSLGLDLRPLVDDHEHQPTKDAQQKYHLGDEFHINIKVSLEMPASERSLSQCTLIIIEGKDFFCC